MIWLITVVLCLAALGIAFWWRNRPNRLPDVWPLALRKVFTQQEQQTFNLLRTAFPDHAVLVKMQVSRFVQLTDKANMKYWFDLLTPLNVTFAVCRHDGRMMAAIDFESAQSPGSRSGYALKRRAFEACKLLYLRYDYNALPTARSLRVSVLGESAADVPVFAQVVNQAANVATAATTNAAAAAAQAINTKELLEKQRIAAEKAAAAAAAEAAAKAEEEKAATLKQLNDLVKDRQRKLKSLDDGKVSWEADSILERDSFLRPDSRLDKVDVAIG